MLLLGLFELHLQLGQLLLEAVQLHPQILSLLLGVLHKDKHQITCKIDEMTTSVCRSVLHGYNRAA